MLDPQRIERLLRHTFIDFQQTSEFIKAPLIFERAEGLYVWDVHGKRYWDAIGGVFVAVLGHRHPRVMEAMRRQMERMTFAPPLHGVADVTLELVDKLGAVAPGTLNFVKPFSAGSESVEAALKCGTGARCGNERAIPARAQAGQRPQEDRAGEQPDLARRSRLVRRLPSIDCVRGRPGRDVRPHRAQPHRGPTACLSGPLTSRRAHRAEQ